jgi:hypothetical protein
MFYGWPYSKGMGFGKATPAGGFGIFPGAVPFAGVPFGCW